MAIGRPLRSSRYAMFGEPRQIDPLARPAPCFLLFGGLFAAAFIYKLGEHLVLKYVVDPPVDVKTPPDDWPAVLRMLSWLVFFGVSAGVSTWVSRRYFMAERSLEAKNTATGVLVGTVYAGGCLCFFTEQSPMTSTIAAIVTFLGTSWAIASGLNQAFRELDAERSTGSPRG